MKYNRLYVVIISALLLGHQSLKYVHSAVDKKKATQTIAASSSS